MKKRLNILLLVDQAILPIDDDTTKEYHEDQPTEFHIMKACRELGHKITILGIFDDVAPVVQTIKEQKPDVIINQTEQFRNNRWLDKDIAGLLELLDIPFTGAGTTGLLLSRNKSICKQILSTRRISVPQHMIILPGKSFKIPRSMAFPFVVKPLMEDASEGISNASLVKTFEELKNRAIFIHERWHEPAIVEQYIDGRELYVSVLGNKRLRVLPSREIYFNENGKNGPAMATARVKWNKDYRVKWNITFGYAELEPGTAIRLATICKKVYRLLHIQDYGRIDLRLAPDNKIYIIEANCNPDLNRFEEVAESALKAGISYPELISQILRQAIFRHKMSH